jgi:hypothetical protein
MLFLELISIVNFLLEVGSAKESNLCSLGVMDKREGRLLDCCCCTVGCRCSSFAFPFSLLFDVFVSQFGLKM